MLSYFYVLAFIVLFLWKPADGAMNVGLSYRLAAKLSKPNLSSKDSKQSIPYQRWLYPIAGGLAGGIANAIIYPIDTIKTMLQTDKSLKSSSQVVNELKKKGLKRIYGGSVPAILGSIPSSALYFGTYEFVKSELSGKWNGTLSRPLIHMIAASAGNIASSFVFVPKETIKQQLQAFKSGTIPWTSVAPITLSSVCGKILRERGLRGFYPSYKATLLRNIPSAMVRFTLYEELKAFIEDNVPKPMQSTMTAMAGGCASCFSSALTTPFDVVKTRLSTGMLPPGSPVFLSILKIAQKEGVGAIYAGALPRIMWSALYGGIGLFCFESIKTALISPHPSTTTPMSQVSLPSKA